MLTAKRAADNNYLEAISLPATIIVNKGLQLPLTVTSPIRLINISTRSQVGTGDNVMIAGFVLGGTTPHQVLIRAIGPSMSQSGVTGVLADPQITLTQVNGTPIASNNNWQDNANQAEIVATGRAPADPKEAALLVTLQPNTPYTPIVSGVGNTTGVALVEVYDADEANTASRLINISTRARVGVGVNVLIGGFVITGPDAKKVLTRAIGPSMSGAGVTETLADPVIQLTKVDGTLIASNNRHYRKLA